MFIIQDVVAGGDTSMIQVEDAGYNLDHMDGAKRSERGEVCTARKYRITKRRKRPGNGVRDEQSGREKRGEVRGSAKAPSASAARKTIDVWGKVRRAA